MKDNFLNDIEHVVFILRETGYDPYKQLYAYIHTGNSTFITRKGNARELVEKLDKNKLWKYIEPYVEHEMD